MTQEARRATQADRDIGRRIQALRKAKGMRTEQLARKIGVSRAQVEKYEAGTNRVGAARLGDIASVLGIRPYVLIGQHEAEIGEPASDYLVHPLPVDALAVAIAFDRIPPGPMRAALASYVQFLSEIPASPPPSA